MRYVLLNYSPKKVPGCELRIFYEYNPNQNSMKSLNTFTGDKNLEKLTIWKILNLRNNNAKKLVMSG